MSDDELWSLLFSVSQVVLEAELLFITGQFYYGYAVWLSGLSGSVSAHLVHLKQQQTDASVSVCVERLRHSGRDEPEQFWDLERDLD